MRRPLVFMGSGRAFPAVQAEQAAEPVVLGLGEVGWIVEGPVTASGHDQRDSVPTRRPFGCFVSLKNGGRADCDLCTG